MNTSKLLSFEKLHNIRDLGGMKAADGRSIIDCINDYLMTNEYLREEIAFLTEFIKGQAGTDSFMSDESLGYLSGARQDYIEEYYNTIF